MDVKFIGSKGAADVMGGKVQLRDKKEPDPVPAKRLNDTQEAFNVFVKCIKDGTQPLASPHYGRLASHLGLMLRASIDQKGKLVTYEEMLKTC
jgi:hypothetical protein